MNKKIIINIIFSVALVLIVLDFLAFSGISRIFHFNANPLILCPGQNKWLEYVATSGVLDADIIMGYQNILTIIIFGLYLIMYAVFEINFFRKKPLVLTSVFLIIFSITYFILSISYGCWAEFFNFGPQYFF